MSAKEDRMIQIQFPLILLKTKRGLAWMEKLGASRVMKPFGWLTLCLMPAIAATGFYLITRTLGVYIESAAARSLARTISPLGNLLIPGLNPYLPIVYGWAALIIGLIVHEGAHGIQAKALKFPVKSSGLLFFLILPIGAFVEIDEKEIMKGRARDSGRVLAAGPGANLVTALVSLALLLLIVGTATPLAKGVGVVGVYEGLPAHQSGIMPQDIIVEVNGVPTPTSDDLADVLDGLKPGDTVGVKIARRHGVATYRVTLASKPEDPSAALIGIRAAYPGIEESLSIYSEASNPLIYLLIPTFSMSQEIIPFSDVMHRFYTSTLGDLYFPLAQLSFWTWFINFNLAIFNALPIYPLDGGQTFKALLKATAGRHFTSKVLTTITMAVTLVIASLVALMLAAPYILPI